MKNKNDHKASNFWFGFALGSIAAVSAAYLAGTKKGRQISKKIIESFDDLEEDPSSFIEDIKGHLLSLKNNVEFEKEDYSETKEIKEEKKNFSTVQSIIDKIKGSNLQEKTNKKFFIKE